MPEPTKDLAPGPICVCRHRWGAHSAPINDSEPSVCMEDGCDCDDFEPSSLCEDLCLDECKGPCGVFS